MENKLHNALNALKKECLRITPEKPGFANEHAAEIRFAGPAYAESGDKAPICNGCGKPLSFVFQFKTEQDAKLKLSGALHVVYYCFDCVPIGRPDDEKGQWLIKSYSEASAGKFVGGTGVNPLFKPCLCSMQKVFVLPDYETIENDYPEVAALCEELDPEDPVSVYEEEGLEVGCEMEPFTRVNGYPAWIQGQGTQVCPLCKHDMEFFAQVDSESAVDLMWGDAGCLYIFRCPKHPEQLAIEMQCF